MSAGGKNTVFWGISIALFLLPFLFYYLDKAPAPTINISPVDASTPVGIEVHVVGALSNPGVYQVKMGTKLHELLAHLNLWPNADTSSINLAKMCRDGQKITIKTIPEKDQGMININLASYNELVALPGIGPSTAKKIIQFRDQHGIIKNKQDLGQIIGKSKAKKSEKKLTY